MCARAGSPTGFITHRRRRLIASTCHGKLMHSEMGGPMKTESADLLIGKVLGGAYKVGRLIGRGGMGSVYEASHVRLPKRYAVKLLQRSLTDDKEAFARFQREAEIASSIGNRHIAEVVDFNFLPNGVPYMVMEYLEGEDLATRLRRVHRLPPRAALDLSRQSPAGLSPPPNPA